MLCENNDVVTFQQLRGNSRTISVTRVLNGHSCSANKKRVPSLIEEFAPRPLSNAAEQEILTGSC